VIEGKLEVTIAGQSRIVGRGSVAIVPPNTPHSVRAIRAGRSIVVDHPLREPPGSSNP
jgi:quercetin dioxygenase-like cupin family protein